MMLTQNTPLSAPLAALFQSLLLLPEEFQPTADRRTLFEFLHAVSPEFPELAVGVAMQQLAAGDFQAAVHELTEAERRCPRHPVLKSLLALAMRANGESGWQAKVHEVSLLEEDEFATAVLDTLEREL